MNIDTWRIADPTQNQLLIVVIIQIKLHNFRLWGRAHFMIHTKGREKHLPANCCKACRTTKQLNAIALILMPIVPRGHVIKQLCTLSHTIIARNDRAVRFIRFTITVRHFIQASLSFPIAVSISFVFELRVLLIAVRLAAL